MRADRLERGARDTGLLGPPAEDLPHTVRVQPPRLHAAPSVDLAEHRPEPGAGGLQPRLGSFDGASVAALPPRDTEVLAMPRLVAFAARDAAAGLGCRT